MVARPDFQLDPESIKILPKMRDFEPAITDAILEIPINHEWYTELARRAREVSASAAGEGIELREPITPEHLVRTLIYWYIHTGGWANVIPPIEE